MSSEVASCLQYREAHMRPQSNQVADWPAKKKSTAKRSPTTMTGLSNWYAVCISTRRARRCTISQDSRNEPASDTRRVIASRRRISFARSYVASTAGSFYPARWTDVRLIGGATYRKQCGLKRLSTAPIDGGGK